MNIDWIKYEGTTVDFTVSSFKQTVNDPLSAAIEAVNDIVKNYPPPYNLLASGGIDSQAMLYAWKKSNHPFNVYTFRYNKTYNSHDMETLHLFGEQENIDYTIVDFDYFKFLEEDYDSIAHRYQCSSPQIAMHIKMASFFNEGTCVYSGNFLGYNGAQLTYAILAVYRFSKTPEGKNVVPYFFLHTPELAHSLIQYSRNNSLDNDLANNSTHNTTYMSRIIMYRATGFPVIPQKEKFTGFEKFKEHYDSHDYVLKDPNTRLRWQKKPSRRPFDWIFRYPYEDKFGCPFITFILNPLPYVIN
jgi:hypothetical protein